LGPVKWQGERKIIKNLFEMPQRPSIIFIDEIDSSVPIARRRTRLNATHQTEFLVQMQGVEIS
jgi:ATP-dependent 26S proteasome regulatory subunit